jgi:Ca2+:H+ antiporter
MLSLTVSNVIELLIAIIALVKGDIDIVQASMIGSILSNILLVLGMSYFAGGLRFHEQLYALAGAQMHISLLGLSVRYPLEFESQLLMIRSRQSSCLLPSIMPTR